MTLVSNSVSSSAQVLNVARNPCTVSSSWPMRLEEMPHCALVERMARPLQRRKHEFAEFERLDLLEQRHHRPRQGNRMRHRVLAFTFRLGDCPQPVPKIDMLPSQRRLVVDAALADDVARPATRENQELERPRRHAGLRLQLAHERGQLLMR